MFGARRYPPQFGVGEAAAGTAAAASSGAAASTGAAAYISAALAAAGALAQYQAAQDAQQNADNQFAANAENDRKYQDKSQRLAVENAQIYDPTQRQANEQGAVTAAEESLKGQLLAARQDAPAPDISGSVSKDYTEGSARTAANELQRSTDIAKLWARMRGPNDLRAGEALHNTSAGEEARSLAADRGFAAGAGGRAAQLAGQPGGAQSAIGGALLNFGSGTLANKLAKAKIPTFGEPTAGFDG